MAKDTNFQFSKRFREPALLLSLELCADYFQVICQLLPTHHRHVFDYIMAFTREVIRFSAQNGVDSKIMATLFARILLRDPPGTNLGTGIKAKAQQQFLDQKKARFIHHFLVNDPEID
jgi:phosphatidylinositol-bisphosphatase